MTEAEQAMKNKCLRIVAEAGYAMVGGNLIKEDIPWATADDWFTWIDQQINEEG
jgi:hypothetical protein